MVLEDVRKRLEERSRTLLQPLTPSQAQACWEEGERMRVILIEERARIQSEWLAQAGQANWARSARAGYAHTSVRSFGRG
jgi:hypothetical protein